jgi:hypothetical protein
VLLQAFRDEIDEQDREVEVGDEEGEISGDGGVALG